MLLAAQELLHTPNYLIQLDASHALAVLLLEDAAVRLVIGAHVCAHQVQQFISDCNTFPLFIALTLATDQYNICELQL
jgi:hypothetical protein